MNETASEEAILSEAAKVLFCSIDQIPGRVEELFSKWKMIVKKKQAVEVTDATP